MLGRLFFSLFCPLLLLAASGDLDTTFGEGMVFTDLSQDSDEAYDSIIDSNGKILVTGETDESDFYVLRYNSDGSLDESFGSDGVAIIDINNSTDISHALTLTSDKKIIVAGSFDITNQDGVLIRLNSDGTVDTTFGTNGFTTVDLGSDSDLFVDVGIDSQERIVTAGQNGDTFNIVRFDANGTLDSSFATDGIASVDVNPGIGQIPKALAIDEDDRIVVVGQGQDSSNGVLMIRLDENGSLDTTFDDDGIVMYDSNKYEGATSVGINENNQIVVGGYVGFTTGYLLLRYENNGTLDSTFGTDGIVTTTINGTNDSINDLKFDDVGNIIVAGATRNTASSFELEFVVARYDTFGTLDTSFDNDGIVTLAVGIENSAANSLNIDSDGTIVVAGYGTIDSNSALGDFALMRLNDDGTLDATFDDDHYVVTDIDQFYNISNDVAVGEDGSIYVLGYVSADDYDHMALSKYGSDGIIDTAFGQNGHYSFHDNASDNYGGAVAIDADGKIVITGNGYFSDSSSNDVIIIRLNTDGTLDTTFDGGVVITDIDNSGDDDSADAMLIDSDGKILVAGSQRPRTHANLVLIRYDTNGSIDTTFGTDGYSVVDLGNDLYANAITQDHDGNIIVAGKYRLGSYQGIALRLDDNGTLDSTFNANGYVTTNVKSLVNTANAVAVDDENKILLLGSGRDDTRYYMTLHRFDTNGSLDGTFGGGDGLIDEILSDSDDDYGEEILLDDSGNIIVIGRSDSSSDSRTFIARYDSDGTLDTTLGDGGIVFHSNGGNTDANRAVYDGNKDIIVVRGIDNSTMDYLLSRILMHDAPTDITLSGSSILENNSIGDLIGNLTATDSDAGDTFTFSFTCNTTGADDASFNIVGDVLNIEVVADYESKTDYDICIQVTDSYNLSYDKNFTITINDDVDTDLDGIEDSLDKDDDNDGMSDDFENTYGLNPFDESDADEDLDNDGYSNLEEYEAGTAPNDENDKPTSGVNPSIIMYLLS